MLATLPGKFKTKKQANELHNQECFHDFGISCAASRRGLCRQSIILSYRQRTKPRNHEISPIHNGSFLGPLTFVPTLSGQFLDELIIKLLKPFSRNGKQKDTEDSRCKALLSIIEKIKTVKKKYLPRYLVLENVKFFERSESCKLLLEVIFDPLSDPYQSYFCASKVYESGSKY